jgi:hypothetical protein
MVWRKKSIASFCVVAIAAVGLCIANERRRIAVITQNNSIARKAELDLDDLRRLGFSERDNAVQSVYEQLQAARMGIDTAHSKWWMISIKTEEKKGKQARLNRLITLNKKLLKNYRQELADMRRFGFPENDPRVVFSRNKVAQTVVELAHLDREYKHVANKKEFMTQRQMDLLKQMIDLNRDCVANYKAEIDDYLAQGLNLKDKRICDIRAKISAKMAENGFLERKLHR